MYNLALFVWANFAASTLRESNTNTQRAEDLQLWLSAHSFFLTIISTYFDLQSYAHKFSDDEGDRASVKALKPVDDGET